MLGQPVSMLLPQVVGFRLTGELPEGATATDLVLTVTQMLRAKGVVGKFVEFYGEGLANMPLADRATIGNMSPEYGATCGIFPVDARDAALPRVHGPPAGARRAGGGLRQGAGALPRREHGGGHLQRHARARHGARSSPASPARSARRTACWCARPARPSARRSRSDLGENGHGHALHDADEASAESFPASDPPASNGGEAGDGQPDTDAAPQPAATAVADEPGRSAGEAARRQRVQAARRRRGDRRDHELHQHLEPVRDGRRRPARQEGGRARPDAQAVGQDQPRAGLEGGHRVPRQGRPDRVPRAAPVQPRRLRLHHLHRQLRSAPAGDLGGDQRAATCRSARCCPATATSRAASTPR